MGHQTFFLKEQTSQNPPLFSQIFLLSLSLTRMNDVITTLSN
ncbi:hypothetical protein CES86_4145 [Brucella lupini]|uniref:Uncharacterized protein n=1 Tax=Brucella lupini TaxID=255457 RepID=A0A256GEA4_9HYPH|nr:hypothetical protein CES86_4145 [Brucella lupini]